MEIRWLHKIEKINEFFVRYGARCLLRVGYGMSEFGGTCVLADSFRTPLDSCGKPMPGSEGIIVNPDTLEEVKPNEEGMFCFRKVSMPPKEFDGKPLYKRKTIKDKEFVVTGDIMTKDEQGNFYFLTRESGMISRYDGYKVIPTNLENCICTHPLVKTCMVSEYYEERRFGNMPFIHIVFNKNLEDTEIELVIKDIVDNYILKNNDLCFRDIPAKWLVKDQIYITPGLKRDIVE